MTDYIDGFVHPVPREHLKHYQQVAEQVAEIWKQHGALDYCEYVLDDADLQGTRSFVEIASPNKDDAVIFGWVKFSSREARDLANQRVAADPRMMELITPLTQTSKLIFDAKRMLYGGFRPLV